MKIPTYCLKELIEKYRKSLLRIYPLSETESIIRIVIREVLNYEFKDIFLKAEEFLNPNKVMQLETILRDLMKHKPVQYVLGFSYFYDFRLEVNENVLIPRQETEELVHWIIEENKNKVNLHVLDIGTGSGCIAITLKKHLKNSNVTAVDISENAINLARKNADKYNILINFITQNILDNSLWKNLEEADLIVSNPPYVTESEKELIKNNVLKFEPHEALFVADQHPMIFYSDIADLALLKLKKNGCVYFEINESYGNKLVELLGNKGFNKIQIKKDLNGKNRMLKAEF